ncbi:uncharacterized protein si:dkey-81h8.1 isoform X4 [Acanthochromis polyacanthus]|uniref:uncharacterized protein si:dkey-81h8.1 isoform X4 n=1 Tax=Acanthochromis polyacanthus TaxID=80966 RepID=UPI0022343DA4|nr:uncharacterized protein si:dkey-81h8.1 isoform X4 [Acanthochromis polyacanthus]
MDSNDKEPMPAAGTLSERQLRSHLKMEPKTLGAIQIVIGALILCLSASVLQIHEVHFTGDVGLFLIVVIQQHCFRKCTGLIEQKCKLLIDGILGTLVIFLVLELLICMTAMLFGLSVLAAGGTQAPSQRPTYPQTRPPPVPAVQVVHPAPAAAEPSQQVAVVVTEPNSEQVEDISTPPTEPQVEPIETVDTQP